jgi:hypothetical protein
MDVVKELASDDISLVDLELVQELATRNHSTSTKWASN